MPQAAASQLTVGHSPCDTWQLHITAASVRPRCTPTLRCPIHGSLTLPHSFTPLPRFCRRAFSNQLVGPIPGELSGATNLVELRLHDNQVPQPHCDGRNTTTTTLLTHVHTLTRALPSAEWHHSGFHSALKARHFVCQWQRHHGLHSRRVVQHTAGDAGLVRQPTHGVAAILPGSRLACNNPHILVRAWGGRVSLQHHCLTAAVQRSNAENNQLGGTLPPSLGSLTNLVTLELGSNSLTGSIPSELWALTKLETLYVSCLFGHCPFWSLTTHTGERAHTEI